MKTNFRKNEPLETDFDLNDESRKDLSVREFEEFILSYLDGELSQKQRKRFEFHMRICRECRDYLAAYERSIELNQAMFPATDSLPKDVPEDLIKAINESKRI